MKAYRAMLYSQYGKNFQDTTPAFDQDASIRWGKARRYQLRGWLPYDRSAAIVDLACGRGWLVHFFMQLGYDNVWGVDISADQIAHAKQITNNVIEDDILTFLEQSPTSYDLITGYDILEHLDRDEVLRFLSASFASLKPGGRLILQTPNAAGPWGGFYYFNDLTHETGLNPNSLRRLMYVNGFEHVAARECGPALWGNSFASTIRSILWSALRLGFISWNLIEIGTMGDRIFTRNFIISGVKPTQ